MKPESGVRILPLFEQKNWKIILKKDQSDQMYQLMIS